MHQINTHYVLQNKYKSNYNTLYLIQLYAKLTKIVFCTIVFQIKHIVSNTIIE